MDLKKIGNHNKKAPVSVPPAQLGSFFFNQLFIQLEKDLLFLRNQTDLSQFSFFEKIRVFIGDFDEDKKYQSNTKPSSTAFLFLQLPSMPGFLIEPSSVGGSYTMHRATKVLPLLQNERGDVKRPEIFVLKSKLLEEFIILDENFVRTHSSDKTLSVKQMSELLILLAESLQSDALAS